MTGVTFCSGIGAPEVAAPDIDWLYSAEIEPFPCSVLKHYRPNVPNLGDMMADDFIDRAKQYGRPDIAVAGTPCQAFSVAGLRRSLGDERGNLTLRFVEIIDAIQPGLIAWENVPGVLNTSDNAFGCFLAALVGADTALVPPRGLRWTDAGLVAGPKRTAAWRILDAQYFGLAQRRERVFVVASAGDGARTGEILFEREGVQRHFAPRREPRERVAPTISARTKGGGGLGTDFDCDGGLIAEPYTLAIRGRGDDCNLEYRTDGTANALMTPNGGRGGIGVGAVAQKMAVRRLTPRECSRLQGFPDDYCQVPYRGKPAADGPMYKALGNSMAVPVLRYILDRAKATR